MEVNTWGAAAVSEKFRLFLRNAFFDDDRISCKTMLRIISLTILIILLGLLELSSHTGA